LLLFCIGSDATILQKQHRPPPPVLVSAHFRLCPDSARLVSAYLYTRQYASECLLVYKTVC